MSKEAMLLIPGIKHVPGDMFTWTDRAARFFQLDHDIPSEKLEYNVGALRTKNALKKLARELADVILIYNGKGYLPHVMTHSNGAVIFSMAKHLEPSIRINQWHAVSPACDEDCLDNGLNEAISNDQIQKIFCYHSSGDRVVRVGGRFRFLAYGRAGYTGFTEVADKTKIINLDMTPWGHSTFAGERRLISFLNTRILPSLKC